MADLIFNPKVKTLFKRGDDFNVMTNRLSDPRFAIPESWLMTEKMDGMSVILSIDVRNGVRSSEFYGRSARTTFSPEQVEYLDGVLSTVEDNLLLSSATSLERVDVYAEFVGPGINNNSHNLDEFDLYVFDVRVNDFWLDWRNVVDIANFLDLNTVKVIYVYGTIETAVEYCQESYPYYVEGLVARTRTYIYDNQGNRVMWKLKCSDFLHGKSV